MILLALPCLFGSLQAPSPSERAPAPTFGIAGSYALPQRGNCLPPGSAQRRPSAFAGGVIGAGTADFIDVYPRFDHFPMAGNLHRDLIVGNYYDLLPGPGTRDYACGTLAYDGHQGIDAGIRSWAEQAIGVPVFAAADGVVIFALDGYDDMNLNGSADPGNIVAISHGDGLRTLYFHLKKNSVAVTVGQQVAAGEQIGLAASSGNSFGPHLHFGAEQDFVSFEPNRGACNLRPSAWRDQAPYPADSSYVYDFAISRVPLTGYYPPAEIPRTNQLLLADPYIYFWGIFAHVPGNSTWRVQFQQPNGVIVFDSGDLSFFNLPSVTYFTWWIYDIAQMHTIPGTWHVRFYLNGSYQFAAPVEVVAAIDPNLNRPPHAVTAAFDPPAPRAGDTIYCRVGADLVLDDPDYDTVRFRYLWKRNGVVVRDVTTAGHADAIPRDLGQEGDTISCTVTPSDGRLDGPPVRVTATL